VADSRIAVLVSGGVDSAVALHRVIERGDAEVTAFYLRIWLEDDVAFLGDCPWEEDLEYVRGVCDLLGVPLEIVSLQREYRERIVEYALAELKKGRTPSSDVLCNSLIKFGAFLEDAGAGYDRVATGHYARTRVDDGGVTHLLRGVDPVKDQTYFLCRLRQEQVARCVFPIGDLPKAEVRRVAREIDLPNADRRDSQGICFLGKIPYDEFVRHHLGDRPGPIVDVETGRRLGRHRGVWFYTIGQRRGLGLAGGPWYVVSKDMSTDTVHVVHGDRLGDHRRRELVVEDLNWIAGPPRSDRLHIRLRHGEKLWPAEISPEAEDRVRVVLDEGDPGIAAGQFAVLYDGEECLGGGAVV